MFLILAEDVCSEARKVEAKGLPPQCPPHFFASLRTLSVDEASAPTHHSPPLLCYRQLFTFAPAIHEYSVMLYMQRPPALAPCISCCGGVKLMPIGLLHKRDWWIRAVLTSVAVQGCKARTSSCERENCGDRHW